MLMEAISDSGSAKLARSLEAIGRPRFRLGASIHRCGLPSRLHRAHGRLLQPLHWRCESSLVLGR